ncbi:MAG: DUF1015 domain-containing protein [Lentisphaerae bacterium]|nr:DUF1015 domain-containing protein [Lentisphaerota bacterium]
MPVFKPFHGLVPPVERAAMVAAVPYDVVNSKEAAALAAGNPYSFLHVSRPEIDMEDGIDLYRDEVYAQARKGFDKIIAEAPLTVDKEAHLYIYKLVMGEQVQTGVFGAASAVDYAENRIKKHEKTRQDKEDDRTRHVMTLRSHTGPAFFTYKDVPAIDELVAAECAKAPLFDFVAPDGIGHTLWRVDAAVSQKLSELFAAVDYFYIADGHHRSAAAARTMQECKPANPNHTGEEDYNYFLAAAFPASQLKILPYNRAVRSLNGMSKDDFMQKLSEKFTVSVTDEPSPSCGGTFKMYLDKTWYTLTPKFDIANLGVIERLDVSILQDNVLAPMLGIDDPRTSKAIDFIGGIRGTAELEKLVNSGDFAVAFSMYPTTVGQLIDIADAGEIMPPKSTWFEPKLRDGLVCHNF